MANEKEPLADVETGSQADKPKAGKDTRVTLPLVRQREKSQVTIVEDDHIHISGHSGARAAVCMHRKDDLSTQVAAASNALSLVYGFGASVEGLRREALRKTRKASAKAPDPEDVQKRVATLVKPVLSGLSTSSFVPMDDLAVEAVGSSSASSLSASGLIVDSEGKGKAMVQVYNQLALVTCFETYDAEPMALLDFLSLELQRLEAAVDQEKAVEEDAVLESTDAVAPCGLCGSSKQRREADKEADKKAEAHQKVDTESPGDEKPEYELQGLEGVSGVTLCGLWWSGWYDVEAKLRVAASHALISDVDGELYAIKVKDADAARKNMLKSLQELDAQLGMKAAVDRLSAALACPVQDECVKPQIGQTFLGLGADMSGVDWAMYDHVIHAVRFPPDDSLAATYIHKTSDEKGALADMLTASPLQCSLSALILVIGGVGWSFEVDLISVSMIVLPLMLRQELRPPFELIRTYRLSHRWNGIGDKMLSGYMDFSPFNDECAAMLALLLSPKTLFGGSEKAFQATISYVALGIAIAYLLFLGVMYFLLHRLARDVASHYNGRASHNAATGIVGGFCLGESRSDQHVPGAVYSWKTGSSRLVEDASYGFVTFE